MASFSPAFHSATAATTPYLHWVAAIEEVLNAHGVCGEWLREPAQRGRLIRYYHAGEAAWMAADALYQFWVGAQRAEREDHDGRELLRAAHRASMRVEGGRG